MVISIYLYAYVPQTFTAEVERIIQATEMRCFRRLLDFYYRDHVTNKEERKSIRHAIGPYKDLITPAKKKANLDGIRK